jgi:sugar phosphate isomerase/epimerase
VRHKIAICQDVLGKIPFEECCERARSFGYDGIELAPFIISDDIRQLITADIDRLSETAARHGLELPALHWLLATPPGMSITSPDPATREATMHFMAALVDFAARAGVPVLVFGSPKQRNIDPAWPLEESRQRGISFLSAMASRCEARGIVVGFEPLGHSVTNFGATAADALALVAQVNSPAFQLHLDVKAMLDEPTPVPELIAAARGHLVHFHANDLNLLGPGMGAVDHEPILRALARIGYTGWISVETFRTDVPPEQVATRSIAYLRGVLDKIALE